jgi:hypothetical protein
MRVASPACDFRRWWPREQIALVRSKLRSSAAARSGYARVAKHYAEQIEQSRADAPSRDLAGLTPAL